MIRLLLLEKPGFPMSESPYCLDSLESNVDITSLLEVLYSFKSKSGTDPIFTLNTIVANPDFEKIKEDNFKEYYFEPFTATYGRYPDHDKSCHYLQRGIHDDLIKPQLHGREHINSEKWILLLREGNPQMLEFFDRFMYDLPNCVCMKENFCCASNSKAEDSVGKGSFLSYCFTDPGIIDL